MRKTFVAGLAVLALPVSAMAQSNPADQARIAALEARLAALESRLVGDSRNVSVTASKALVLTAGDEVVIQAGKSKLVLRKNGVVELSGSDIIINGDRSVTAKQAGEVVIKGSKIGQN
jgi:hypothetical protein